jgi:predicted aspartyl protease
MIRGRVDKAGNILLEVTVRGARSGTVVEGHLDTEFGGADLSLPIDVAVALGLNLEGRMTFVLGTGEETVQLVFSGFAQMGDEREREVYVILNDSDDVLISRNWLRGHSLQANYVTGDVIIQPETRQRTRRRRQ